SRRIMPSDSYSTLIRCCENRQTGGDVRGLAGVRGRGTRGPGTSCAAAVAAVAIPLKSSRLESRIPCCQYRGNRGGSALFPAPPRQFRGLANGRLAIALPPLVLPLGLLDPGHPPEQKKRRQRVIERLPASHFGQRG